jgi:hypothetical protein
VSRPSFETKRLEDVQSLELSELAESTVLERIPNIAARILDCR